MQMLSTLIHQALDQIAADTHRAIYIDALFVTRSTVNGDNTETLHFSNGEKLTISTENNTGTAVWTHVHPYKTVYAEEIPSLAVAAAVDMHCDVLWDAAFSE